LDGGAMQPTANNAMLTNAEYHSLPSVSKSGLDLIRRCPALYKYRRENPIDPTPQMRMGTLTHTAILEPDVFASTIAVAPEVDRRTKEGKLAWEDFCAESGDKEVITAAEMERLEGMREALRAHPAARKALEQIAEVERSIFFQSGGVDCRCRPDAILRNGVMLDLKTTRDASADAFSRSMATFRYHVQAAFYSDGYAAETGQTPPGFVFLAVETEPPYLCAVYVASEAMILRGRRDYIEDLKTYRTCLETDTWPGLSPDPVMIDLPAWA
jgi:hypothetical protein